MGGERGSRRSVLAARLDDDNDDDDILQYITCVAVSVCVFACVRLHRRL